MSIRRRFSQDKGKREAAFSVAFVLCFLLLYSQITKIWKLVDEKREMENGKKMKTLKADLANIQLIKIMHSAPFTCIVNWYYYLYSNLCAFCSLYSCRPELAKNSVTQIVFSQGVEKNVRQSMIWETDAEEIVNGVCLCILAKQTMTWYFAGKFPRFLLASDHNSMC